MIRYKLLLHVELESLNNSRKQLSEPQQLKKYTQQLSETRIGEPQLILPTSYAEHEPGSFPVSL